MEHELLSRVLGSRFLHELDIFVLFCESKQKHVILDDNLCIIR